MSKRTKFYSRNFSNNNENRELENTEDNNDTDTDVNDLTNTELTTNSEEEDMLLINEEVKKELNENISEIIDKNLEEIKSKVQPVVTKKEFKVDVNDYVSSTLLSYYEHTNASKIISNDEIARWNYSLYKLFMYILDLPVDEFKKNWQTLLSFFNEYKEDCFNHYKLYRAPTNWPGTEEEFKIYKTLGYICVETADPQNRNKVIKELRNLENILNILKEDHKNKINSFYF